MVAVGSEEAFIILIMTNCAGRNPSQRYDQPVGVGATCARSQSAQTPYPLCTSATNTKLLKHHKPQAI